MSRTLIFLASTFPVAVATFLAKSGYRVLEAQSVKAAELVAEHHDVDAIVVVARKVCPGLRELRRHHVTFNLNAGATAESQNAV